MSNKKESTKIKDFVRIGVFTALWIATSWIIACTIGFFPTRHACTSLSSWTYRRDDFSCNVV